MAPGDSPKLTLRSNPRQETASKLCANHRTLNSLKYHGVAADNGTSAQGNSLIYMPDNAGYRYFY
jgi:hypothetical protein